MSIIVRMFFLSLLFSLSAFGAWPTYHGASDLRGVSDANILVPLNEAWHILLGGAIYAPPVSDGKYIYLAAKAGHIFAVDLGGKRIWEQSFERTNDAGNIVPVRFDAPLTVFDGLVFASASRGVLYALEASTGKTRWKVNLDGVIRGSPNRIEINQQPAVIVIEQSTGVVHAFELKRGIKLWESTGVDRCDSSPGVKGKNIVFGSCASAIHLFSTEKGTHRFDIDMTDDAQLAGGVAVDGSQAFAGTRDGSLICAELALGKIDWRFDDATEQSFTTPAVSSNVVVFSSDNGVVYALRRNLSSENKAQKRLLWSFDTGGIPSSPIIFHNHVAVSADGVLYVLGLKQGDKRWFKEISDEITSPAIINGLLVVGADDGSLHAFGRVNHE